MDRLPEVSREKFVAQVHEELEEMLRGVMDAVNQAPPGRIIADSEEQVRDLFGEFRRKAYERALQMKVDAAEASFPPSVEPDDPSAAAKQGPAGL